jgi:hypothetical protein
VRRFGVFGVTLAALPFAVVLGTVSTPEAPPPARSSASAWRAGAPAALSNRAHGDLPFGTRKYEFYFTRAIYSSGYFGYGYGRRGGSWAVDYPKADQQFLSVLGRLARTLDSYPNDNAMRLDDPNLRYFPFLYAVEVGRMDLSDPEVQGLRSYLLAGGFLIVDDFWGSYEWSNFEENIRRVLPEYEIVDVPLTHPIFHAYYEIDEVLQVPNYNNGCAGGPYYERDGIVPRVRGIFNERGRLLVLISWNSDLGDAWEWMELACYPLPMSTYAYQLGVNTIVYAMSH